MTSLDVDMELGNLILVTRLIVLEISTYMMMCLDLESQMTSGELSSFISLSATLWDVCTFRAFSSTH